MVEFNIVSVDMSVISDGPDDSSVHSFVSDDCAISLVGVVVGAVVGAAVGVLVGVLEGAVVGFVAGVVVGVLVIMVGVVDKLVFVGPSDPSANSVVADDLMDVLLIFLVGVTDVMVFRCVCIVVIIIVTVSIKVENPSMVVVWVE